MSKGSFDRAGGAVAMTRRASLRLLGAAGLAGALAAPKEMRAAKAAKGAKTVCTRQRDGCERGVRAFCEEAGLCLETILPCCHVLAACRTTAAVECLATFGGTVAGPSSAPR